MPRSTSTTSELADDHSSVPSVLDFLYHDSRRIGSFLSQFEGDGHLQQLTRIKDASRGKNETAKVGGKANVGVASGSLDSDVQTSLLSKEGYSRVFDPYWANARAFLDFLSERDMVNRDLVKAEVGQFVLVRGYLSVLDLSMMQQAWKLPSVQRRIFGGEGKKLSQMTAAERVASKDSKENTTLMLDMMQIMPHSVHASLITDDEENTTLVWSALRDEYLVQPASEITLAHGAQMPGVWSVVGILTAFPEHVLPELEGDVNDDNMGTFISMVGAVSKLLAPIVRFALGRPAAAHAVTPLLIFREVV